MGLFSKNKPKQENDLNIQILPTPNPNARKFVLNKGVKTIGKATFNDIVDCPDVPLAKALFTIRGVDQIHFFQNVITISKYAYEEWETIEYKVKDFIKQKIPKHNPDFVIKNPEEERRNNLSAELQIVEKILDEKIRPFLQADGGDLKCLSLEKHVLIVQYEGACGSCPSSTEGTLMAIKNTLRDHFDPDLDVYTAPPA